MQIKRFCRLMIFAGVLFLLPEIPVAAEENSAASNEEYYLNWWGLNDVNRNDWKKGSESDLTQPGMYEISIYPPGTEATPEQLRAAKDLYDQTLLAAKRNDWFDYEQGRKDGFVPHDLWHYVNVDYVYDGRTLDPEHPEVLMYYWTPTGQKFVGVMYLLPYPDEHGPQVGGPLTIWHFHISATPDTMLENGHCNLGGGLPGYRSAEMMHVWLVELPDGPFTSNMTLPSHIYQELINLPTDRIPEKNFFDVLPK